jgi:hypothetical protein
MNELEKTLCKKRAAEVDCGRQRCRYPLGKIHTMS